MYVDSDHAGEKKTRRSRTGFFIFLNSALIQWLSRRQPTIETSVFGAEFVALKNGMECLRGLRYKLRMMGVPISGPSYIYGDNMSVIKNTQTPQRRVISLSVCQLRGQAKILNINDDFGKSCVGSSFCVSGEG
ncbi:hypothetical protein THAOC_19435 [Thalassiosira oceanica]|uniref:Reverse transcriptase Ty1/copia-type domain-containing protein n=1 Tax=Thalassiosira oceanica TaxID=159749 RepID=K0S2H5_THAOC|nr:hypothetical protein THAOC_19435 [Thalassiosira oceanica]|eukprot:EJK60248.1 hypothetical protein THAOC_19435 [Thalassiosira oceanica]